GPQSDGSSGLGRPLSDLLVSIVRLCSPAGIFTARCPGLYSRGFPAHSGTSGTQRGRPAQRQVSVISALLLSELSFSQDAASAQTKARRSVSVCFPGPGNCREPLSIRASGLFNGGEDLRGPLGADAAGARDDRRAPGICCSGEGISL